MTSDIKKFAASTAVAATLTLPGMMFAMPVMADTTTYQQMSKEVDQAVDSVGEYTQEKQAQTVKKIKASIAEIDQELAELENGIRDNWNDMTEVSREKTKAALQDLREKRNALGERYGELKSAGKESWVDLKDDFSDAWRDFKTSWSDAFNSAQTDK
jgi:septal ring factor EnvC (AmiA/AmiB activator)